MDFTGDISPENRRKIGTLLHKCGRTMFFHSKKAVQQTEVLKLLKDGPISQKDIQERLGVQPATVSELISKLETKGLVTRERSETDRRVVVLSLTEAGKHSVNKRENEQVEKEIVICLDEQEQEQLIALLEKLNEGFEQSMK